LNCRKTNFYFGFQPRQVFKCRAGLKFLGVIISVETEKLPVNISILTEEFTLFTLFY